MTSSTFSSVPALNKQASVQHRLPARPYLVSMLSLIALSNVLLIKEHTASPPCNISDASLPSCSSERQQRRAGTEGFFQHGTPLVRSCTACNGTDLRSNMGSRRRPRYFQRSCVERLGEQQRQYFPRRCGFPFSGSLCRLPQCCHGTEHSEGQSLSIFSVTFRSQRSLNFTFPCVSHASQFCRNWTCHRFIRTPRI